MSARRIVLTIGWLTLVVTAAQPVLAVNTELEANAYDGVTTGGWTCGPLARARYGGLGATVRVAQRTASDSHGEGWNARATAAGEYETSRVVDPRCENDCEASDWVTPPSRLLVGLAARGGYRWKWFGLEAGPQAYQGWHKNTDSTPEIKLVPDFAFRFGPQHRIEILAGYGSPGVTTARRPSGYLGAEIAVGQGHRVGAWGGVSRRGPSTLDDLGSRFDASWRAPISETVFLRSGGSLGLKDSTVRSGEVSLGVGAIL
jgi:hypothetical protein